MAIYPMNGSRLPVPLLNGVPPFVAGNITSSQGTSTGVQVSVTSGLGVSTGNSGGCAGAQSVIPNSNSGVINGPHDETNWRQNGEEMRRLRTRHVVLIERMLRNHQPHDVLTQVPENYDWHSKTFALAMKIERLMFAAATSRENYLNESTLRQRVQMLSRHLVRIRKRKNAVAASYETRV